MLRAGDWVQATEEISEANFNGAPLWIHSRKGGIGHVLEALRDGWLNVFFERSGTVTVCHPSQVVQLCNADASLVV